VAIGDGNNLEADHGGLFWGLDFLATRHQLREGTDVSWVISHSSHRPYVDVDAMRQEAAQILGWKRHLPWRRKYRRAPLKVTGHYIYNLAYRAKPAPIRLKPDEERIAAQWSSRPFAVIEPFIKPGAPPSKQWPVERYIEVARQLSCHMPVYQIGSPESPVLSEFPQIRPRSFREAMAYLKAARVYVGPEGGLHHASAAVRTRAVVIYGGFTSPLITGYDFHVNLTGGTEWACGTRKGMCPHCRQAMENIKVDEVLKHARDLAAS
jgi:ADP-heptose:LPS heptosyltransferase